MDWWVGLDGVGARSPHGGAVVWLDGGALRCARLLVLVRDCTAVLAPGTVLHVATEDPIAPIDLPAWCRLTGHEWLGAVRGTTRPTFAIRVVTAAATTQEAHPWRRA